MRCAVCTKEGLYRCPCGLQVYCGADECVDVHLEGCDDQPIGAPESDTGSTTEGTAPVRTTGTLGIAQEFLDDNPKKSFATLKRRMVSVYPLEKYPYKVLNYDRCNLKTLRLTRDNSLSVAKDSSPQRFNRDFRGPWTPLRGGILSFPTGSGKTRLMHAILGNYNRVLMDAVDPKTGMLQPRHKQLIYVTKTELVVDARKDFAAQKDRTQDSITALLDRHGIPHSDENSFAPFNPAVNIMSYRTFSNMLEGENAAGRRLWAGLQISDTTVVQPNPQIKGVPVAFHKMPTGEWQRGNLPHNWAELQEGRPTISFTVRRTSGRLPDLGTERYRTDFVDRMATDWLAFLRSERVKADYVLMDIEIVASPLGQRESRLSLQTLWDGEIPPQKLWDRFVTQYARTAIREVITKPLRGPGISILQLTISRELPPQSAASAFTDWKLVKLAQNKYTWEAVEDSAQDRALVEAAREFNPLDTLVVVFDEGDLLFNREKLLAGERAKTDLITKALRESSAIAFFGSGTIDLFPRLSMLSALTPAEKQPRTMFPYEPFNIEDLSGAVKISYVEARSIMQDFISIGKKDLALDPKFLTRFKGLTSHSTVEGMRDFFPEFLYDPYDKPGQYTHFVPLPLEHAKLISESMLEVSPLTLMQRISYAGVHDDLLDVASPKFDPDYAYRYLVLENHMPILRELLRDLRKHDEQEFAQWGTRNSKLPLSRRAIMSSLADDADGIAKVAAAMVAVGYRWLPLVPKDTAVNKLARRAMRKKGEKLPDRLRSMQFAEPLFRPARDDLIDPLHKPFARESEPPTMVVLSEALFSQRAKEAQDISTYESLGLYSRKRNFKTPYKFKGVSKLRAEGIDQALRQLVAKKVLYYYDASEEAMETVDKTWDKGSYQYSFFTALDRPTLYVKTRIFDEYNGSYNLLPTKVEMDLPAFDTLRTLVEVSTSLSNTEREDAKEMLIDFANSLECFKINARYSLVGRKIGGQGIDIFRTTVGYNIDVAPDYRTQVQRRGRLGRRCGHKDLEFERHTVQIHTYVAVWPSDYAAPRYEEITGKDDDDDEDNDEEHHLPGEKEAVRAIEVDPLAIETTSVYTASDALMPYEIVRIRSEEPALTRLRLWGEKAFDAMAIDEDYNRIQVDSEEEPLYSKTNYVLDVKHASKVFRNSVVEEQRRFEDASQDLATALARLDVEYKEVLAKELALFQAGQGSIDTIQQLGEFYTNRKNEESKKFDAAVLSVRVDKAQATADVFEAIAQTRESVPLWRRAAKDPRERHLMVNEQPPMMLDPVSFGIASDSNPLEFLQYLVQHQFAAWDPKASDPKTRGKRKGDAEGSAEKRPTPQPPESKRKQDDEESEGKRAKVGDILPRFLIGAEDDEELEVFVSFGTVIETTNFADEEQEAIESFAAQKFEEIVRNLQLWEEPITKPNPEVDLWVSSYEEAVVAYLYSIFKGGAASLQNATTLKKVLLDLYTNGVMNWNRGLELFAHVMRALKDRMPSKSSEALAFITATGRFCAKLYSYALHAPSATKTFTYLHDTYSLDFGSTPVDFEHLVDNLDWWRRNRAEPFELFVEQLRDEYYIDIANSWFPLQKALQDSTLRRNFELQTLFKKLTAIKLIESELTTNVDASEFLKLLSRGLVPSEALPRSSPELAAKSALIMALTEDFPLESYAVLYPKSTVEIVDYLALPAQATYASALESLILEGGKNRPNKDRQFYLNLIATKWDEIENKPNRSKLRKALKTSKVVVVKSGFKATAEKQLLYYRENEPDRIFYRKKKEEVAFPYALTVEEYVTGRIEFVGEANKLSSTFRDNLVDQLSSEPAFAELVSSTEDRAILSARLAEFIKDRSYGVLLAYASPRPDIRSYINFVSTLDAKKQQRLERINMLFGKLDSNFNVRSILFQEGGDPMLKLDFNAEDDALYKLALGWILEQDTEELLLRKKLQFFSEGFSSTPRMLELLVQQLGKADPYVATLKEQATRIEKELKSMTLD